VQLADDGQTVVVGGKRFANHAVNSMALARVSTLEVLGSRVVERLGAPSALSGVQYLLDPSNREPDDLGTYAKYARVIVDSFWGWFGWMQLQLPEGVYVALRLVTALVFVVPLLLHWRRPQTSSPLEYGVFLGLVVIGIGFFFAFIRQLPPHGLPQGRYALPVIVPLVTILCLSWRSIAVDALRMRSTVIWPVSTLVFFGLVNALSIAAIITGSSRGY
jgi:hypothetical protein